MEDNPEGGTIFVISLPDHHAMTQQYVYIVDDDRSDSRLAQLVVAIRAALLPALWLPSAEDFLEAWTPALTGCILLDIRMERMSGTELFERLLELGCCTLFQVIFLTGHGDVPMAVSTVENQHVDFFENRATTMNSLIVW